MITSIKTCIKCLLDKNADDYYKHPATADGRLGKCKECCRADARNNRREKIEKYRAHDRARGNRHTKEYTDNRKAEFPKVRAAHSAVSNAIRSGKMYRIESCEECGSQDNIVGHHDDYDEPLEVRWLCQVCHSGWHRENGPGANRT